MSGRDVSKLLYPATRWLVERPRKKSGRALGEAVNERLSVLSFPWQLRDLKLENILLDDCCRCKIADFGLSHFVVGNTGMKTEAGTLAYLAPEVWSQTSQYSSPFQLDVWALG